MEQLGKAFLGGLGALASDSPHSHFGVWACVRGWDEREQRRCGSRSPPLFTLSPTHSPTPRYLSLPLFLYH